MQCCSYDCKCYSIWAVSDSPHTIPHDTWRKAFPVHTWQMMHLFGKPGNKCLKLRLSIPVNEIAHPCLSRRAFVLFCPPAGRNVEFLHHSSSSYQPNSSSRGRDIPPSCEHGEIPCVRGDPCGGFGGTGSDIFPLLCSCASSSASTVSMALRWFIV